MAVMADLGASILAKLKNKAKESNINYQQCLQLFFQEEFLRRLSKSPYANNFILDRCFSVSGLCLAGIRGSFSKEMGCGMP